MHLVAIERVNLCDPNHGRGLLALLDHYARHPMGGGRGLSSEVRDTLVVRLREETAYVGFLACCDGNACGLINCFYGFSTFAARRLLNIHDIVVHEQWRGRGIAGMLLGAVEGEARRTDCCKLTLEVLDKNEVARGVYSKFGFRAYALDPSAGTAIFLEKHL